jgi:cytochrome oxidase Cu insertion factor (SCO1/SenC/PrrC family)
MPEHRGETVEAPSRKPEGSAGRVGMRANLVVGGRFPDLELPDHRGQPVKLSKLADGYPLIVSFYRGYW